MSKSSQYRNNRRNYLPRQEPRAVHLVVAFEWTVIAFVVVAAVIVWGDVLGVYHA